MIFDETRFPFQENNEAPTSTLDFSQFYNFEEQILGSTDQFKPAAEAKSSFSNSPDSSLLSAPVSPAAQTLAHSQLQFSPQPSSFSFTRPSASSRPRRLIQQPSCFFSRSSWSSLFTQPKQILQPRRIQPDHSFIWSGSFQRPYGCTILQRTA